MWHAEAGEDFLLPVVGQVADEAVVDDFGDEAGSGDAALLQGWRQRRDDGLGDGVVDADVFGTHELDAVEFGGLEAELLAHFLADAAEGGRLKLDFGGKEFFALDGKMIRDARGAGLLRTLFVILDLSRRSGVCGHGGVGLFCLVVHPSRSSSWEGSSFSLETPKTRRLMASMVWRSTRFSAERRSMMASRLAISSSRCCSLGVVHCWNEQQSNPHAMEICNMLADVFFHPISYHAPAAAVAHVDAIEQQCERGGTETQLAILHIGWLGPGEGAFSSRFAKIQIPLPSQ
jgi:hypothetical protein